MPYVLTDPPEGEPVTLDEAKAHLRVETAEEDALITALIAAARQYVERETNRSLLTQTWRLSLDAFPRGPIALAYGPIETIDAFAYLDTAGATQALAVDDDYAVDELPADRPRLVPSIAARIWPHTYHQPGAVTVDFTAGYGAAADVPEALKLAMLMMVANWYANREATASGPLSPAPLGAEVLIASFRIPLLS